MKMRVHWKQKVHIAQDHLQQRLVVSVVVVNKMQPIADRHDNFSSIGSIDIFMFGMAFLGIDQAYILSATDMNNTSRLDRCLLDTIVVDDDLSDDSVDERLRLHSANEMFTVACGCCDGVGGKGLLGG
jgi:hypothetical protein